MKKPYRITKIELNKAYTRNIYSKEYYSILFVSQGSCYFRLHDAPRHCSSEDMILMKPNEIVILEYSGGRYPLQLLWVQFSTELLEELSNEETDLEKSLNVVPFQSVIVRTSSELSMMIKNLSRKLLMIQTENDEFAYALFEKSLLTMLIVLVLRACIRADLQQRRDSRKHFMIDDLFVYINVHIQEEITLEQLEEQFFVSRYHISREFKKQTGQTIHQYIVKKKLELCKRHIEGGKPIIEVYHLGGFGGYNHFFRAFKKEYGMTPKEYYRSF